MQINLNLEKTILSCIGDDESQGYLKRSAGEIERSIEGEIESAIKNNKFEVGNFVQRAKALIERRSTYPFLQENWKDIEHSLRKDLERIDREVKKNSKK